MFLRTGPAETLASLVNGFREFVGNKRGNVGIIFGASLIPLIGMTGLAIDYGVATSDKIKLDNAADAAAIAAVTTAGNYYTTNSATDANAQADAVSAGLAQAVSAFAVNAGSVAFATVPTPTINLVPNGLNFTATVTYKTSSTNHFGQIFGSNSIAIVGSAQSTRTLPRYMNFYIAVDVSQSMGLGATTSDMTNLYSKVSCVFGCHVPQSGQSVSNESVAHNANPSITLRIDVIRQAIQSMITSAQGDKDPAGNPLVKFGIYTIQYDSTTVTAPTSNSATLTTAVNNIDLGPNNAGGTGDSNFATSLATLASSFPASGDGSSASKPLNFVFIMTDGVQDVAGNCTSGHCTKAFDSSLCAPFKNKGATVGVIYTTYLPIFNTIADYSIPGSTDYNINYQQLVLPFASSLTPNLTTCASSGYFYQATDGPSIQAAINALFAQTYSVARLAQ